MPLTPTVLQGIAEFNRREFFEAHETLEEAWAEETGAERLFLQGLIQVAIACCHVQRGNAEGALHLFAAACLKLSGFLPARGGIDVASLLEASERCAGRVRASGVRDFDPALFPMIRVAP